MGGCCTLGVTWYSTSVDEADMALNMNFPWSTDGVNHYDVETVMLHENGHVLGLGHSNVSGAVMEPYYGEVRRALHADDIDGVRFLYPLSPAVCGDATCDAGEDQCTCSDDCGAAPTTEAACSDGVDNDCDSLTDEDDLDCCTTTSGESLEELTCRDTIDNDCDSFVDCGDVDCKLDSDCAGLLPVGSVCTDGSQCLSGKCKGKPDSKTCK